MVQSPCHGSANVQPRMSTFPPITATSDAEAPEKTLSERAFRLLREDVLNARLKPGAKLRAAELQTRYQIGLSPLREALLRLASEGLVEADGQRGFAVASVSLAELKDLTEARICLETALMREAITKGDADWEAAIVAAFHALSRTPVPTSTSDDEAVTLWERRHRQFHRALVAGCNSIWLLKLHTQLVEHSERYRRVRLFHSSTPLFLERRINDEHQELMDALISRNADRAGELVRRHLQYTADTVAGLWQPNQIDDVNAKPPTKSKR